MKVYARVLGIIGAVVHLVNVVHAYFTALRQKAAMQTSMAEIM